MRRTWILAAGAALAGAVFTGLLCLPGLAGTGASVLSDLAQLTAAVLASAGCAVAAGRTDGDRRRAWWWLSLGTGAWAAGQTVWSYYELALDRAVPFPSLADFGFLTFPLAAAVGLVLWLGTQSHELVARGRDVLDGAIIAASLLVLSWVTTLGTVVAGRADALLPLMLSLAYPIGDLVLATLVLLALARGTVAERTTLAVLGLGLGALALSDSVYVYLSTTGQYSSADLITAGWVFGFLFVGVAGLSVPAARLTPHTGATAAPVVRRRSVLRLLLPYLPLILATAVLCVHLVRSPATPTVGLFLGVILVSLVLLRQFLAMADNQRLLVALAEARDQLEHQALHDALTGLANRVLFADRLDRALLQPAAQVSVLFCDLDDFKLVNDQLGHEAGDALLRQVAQRLLACVRVTDTVARLGGDEFAILLEDSTDALEVAGRVVAALHREIEVAGRPVRTSVSIGIAHHRGTPAPRDERRGERSSSDVRRTPIPTAHDMALTAQRQATAALLLRHADTAMYAAKGAGKGRAVLAGQGAKTS